MSTSAATLTDARALWPDADAVDDATLTRLLDAAWVRCEAFIPAEQTAVVPLPPDVIADRGAAWVQANVLDARDLWTAYRRDGDVIGFDSYAVRVVPLSPTVRSLLRPARGVPMVGWPVRLVADARDAVAAAVAPTGLYVVAFPRDLDQVTEPSAVIVVEQVDPPGVACPDRVVTLAIWVVSHLTDPGVADDSADTALDTVLDALDAAGVAWTQAERAVWRDRHAAYRVTVEVWRMSVVGYVVKAMTVKVKQGTAAEVAYECAVTGVREGVTRTTVTTQVACPDGSKTDTGPAAWTVEVAYNVSNLPASFHRLLRDHDGEAASLIIEPFPVQEPGHLITYAVTLNAAAADYTVGAFGTATATLSVDGSPAHTDPTTWPGVLSAYTASQRERAAVAAFQRLPRDLVKELRKETASAVVPMMRTAAARHAGSSLEARLAATASYTAWRGVPGVAFGGKRGVTGDGTPGRTLVRAVEFGSDGRRWANYESRRGSSRFPVLRRTTRQVMPDVSTVGRFVTPAAEQVADDVLDLWVDLVETMTVRALDGGS